jgi:hypothetical protein
VSDLARALSAGWSSHFEGVIARDGDDRLTLANYFRDTEARVESRRLFATFYELNAAFRDAFLRLLAAKARNSELTLLDVTQLMDPLARELADTLRSDIEREALAQLDTFLRVTRAEAMGMWYFDMYGRDRSSWEARWASAGRGTPLKSWAFA